MLGIVMIVVPVPVVPGLGGISRPYAHPGLAIPWLRMPVVRRPWFLLAVFLVPGVLRLASWGAAGWLVATSRR